jgi:hypothetical protein
MTSSSFRRLDAKGTKKKSAVLSSHATANRNDENLESGKQVALSVSLPDQKKKKQQPLFRFSVAVTTPTPHKDRCTIRTYTVAESLYNTPLKGTNAHATRGANPSHSSCLLRIRVTQKHVPFLHIGFYKI